MSSSGLTYSLVPLLPPLSRSSSRALTSKPTPKQKSRARRELAWRQLSAIFSSWVSPAVGRPSVRKRT